MWLLAFCWEFGAGDRSRLGRSAIAEFRLNFRMAD